MATLTNSTAFTIAAQATAVSGTTVEVIAAGAPGTGRGRLIHPTLGTYDYQYQPHEWTNIDGDVIVVPNWQASATLNDGQGTLWTGNERDVECSETWLADDLSMPIYQFRMLLNIFMNPPDPADNYVQWWPQYTTTLGYDVMIKSLTVGQQGGIKFSDVSMQGFLDEDVTIVYQIVQAAQ